MRRTAAAVLLLTFLLPAPAAAQEECPSIPCSSVVTVPSDEYRELALTGRAGGVLSITVSEVAGGPVEVLVLNRTNLEHYVNSVLGNPEPFTPNFRAAVPDDAYRSYRFVTETSEPYTVVVDNTPWGEEYSGEDATARVALADVTTPGPGAVEVVAVAAVVGIALASRARGGRSGRR